MNKKSKVNLLKNNLKNLLNLLDNKKSLNIDNTESICQTKEIKKGNKENEKKNKKENDKIKNMTINICNQDNKNLLFLLKLPKTTSHSNKISKKLISINSGSPKMTQKPFSSYKNSKNEEKYIFSKLEENSRNSTTKMKKPLDQIKLNHNDVISDFYENNINIHNSRNYISRRKDLLNNKYKNYDDFLKSNRIYMSDHLIEKSAFSSYNNLQINESKIFHKMKFKEIIKNINKKCEDYKIDIKNFVLYNKNLKDIKKNKLKVNINMKVPFINKRSVSVSRLSMKKKV